MEGAPPAAAEDLREWDVDFWYPFCKELTYETLFVPLSDDDMKDLSQKRCSFSLEAKVDDCIKRVGGVAFVRVSGLSPKDAVKSDSERLAGLLREQLRDVRRGDRDEEVAAVSRAAWMALKVRSGHEAMSLFCGSDRVAGHLERRRGEEGRSSIVIRRWDEQCRCEWEFRTFISHNRLIATSHYYKHLFVASVAARRNDVANAIETFYKTNMFKKMPMEQYVADFAVDPTTLRVVMVEVNPWARNTSCALMDWDDLEERSKSEDTSRDGEFRCLMKAELGFEGRELSMFWRALIDVARGEDPSHASETKVDLKQCAELEKWLKKEAKKRKVRQRLDASDEKTLMNDASERGFVTESELTVLGFTAALTGGDGTFCLSTCIFLLWLCATNQRRHPCFEQCVQYVVAHHPRQERQNLVHNACMLMKSLKMIE